MELTQLTFFPRHTRITLRFRNHLYSSQIPNLARRLVEVLPHLDEHQCRNRSNLPFAEELNDTELGHVFEHVVLALLSTMDIFTRGQTTWNWQRDPIGTFHVTIATGKRSAVKQCILVAQAIMTNILIGPPVKLRPITLDHPGAVVPLTLDRNRSEPERLLFSADPTEAEQQPSPARAGLGR